VTCANASFLTPLTRYHRPYALTACEPVALVVLSEAAALAAVRHAGHVSARQRAAWTDRVTPPA
jgi:hypothetical protein